METANQAQIDEALRLLNEHEEARRRCEVFLKTVGEPGYDPISLKLWVANAQMKAARESKQAAA